MFLKLFPGGKFEKRLFSAFFNFKFYILELFRKSGEDFSLQNIFHFKNFLKNILEREIFSRFPEKFQNVKFENVFSAKLAVFIFPLKVSSPGEREKFQNVNFSLGKVPNVKLFTGKKEKSSKM